MGLSTGRIRRVSRDLNSVFAAGMSALTAFDSKAELQVKKLFDELPSSVVVSNLFWGRTHAVGRKKLLFVADNAHFKTSVEEPTRVS